MAGFKSYSIVGEDDNDFEFGNSFFRNYDTGSQVNVAARIGNYPASIYGVWKPTEDGGCGICGRGASKPKVSHATDATCAHPFTLYTAAREIAYLLKCRGQRDTDFWVVAEEEWKKEADAAQKTVDAKEAKVAGLISEVYQFVGLVAAFQGLLITAASQLSASDNCGSPFWWLLALSLFATLVTAIGVTNKVGSVRVFKDARNNAYPILHERIRLLRKLTLLDGPGFDLAPSIIHKPRVGKFHTFLKERIYPVFEYSAFILACLIVFGAICGLALAFICK